MLLFAGDAITGAHDAAVFPSALAYAHTSKRCVRQTAVIFGVVKMRFRVPGAVVGAEPEVFVEAVRFDHFAWIHLPLRVPDGFKLAKGLHQLRAKHPRKKLRAS